MGGDAGGYCVDTVGWVFGGRVEMVDAGVFVDTGDQ